CARLSWCWPRNSHSNSRLRPAPHFPLHLHRRIQMNRPFTFKLLAGLSLWLGLAAAASAATLQAKVIEVQSGNTLVVTNINRPVSVRLKAIVPPEVGQPFNDVARDHLKALVLDKTVTVEYTHFADNYLEARVFFNNIDIGSQMLRDGVA